MMGIESGRKRLSQVHNLEWIGRDLKATNMVAVVRWNLENLRQDYFILGGLIPVKARKEIKRGINRLEYVLHSRKVKGVEKHIIFLRCLWDLRNTRGGSHRELLGDSRYKRASAHFNLENLNRQEAFAKILEEAVEFLDFLITVVRSGKLSGKIE